MHESSAILLERDEHDAWMRVRIGAPHLANARPGQFAALRLTLPGSYDPLLRQPLVIDSQPSAGTCTLLIERDDPAARFLSQLPRGAMLDMLGPLGRGWQIDDSTRTIAMVGVATHAAALFALAQHAVTHGRAASVILGAVSREVAPPPFWLPAAAEYNVAVSRADASAALAQLDDQTLRWADMLAIALPDAYWSRVARRVDDVRIRWSRGFAQVAVLPPMPCCVGVCGACAIETRKGSRLACVDGPVIDLRDLTR
jgi:dihydroorotate dehydrogenase electron transfer subunit